ncbi:MAG TPA: GNAT family N-acetyltransferase [Thermoleophilaceae bacterium]|nr:GNAT family N-acetyltransferase [Thermoleophilaceae bacterium]
MSTARIWLAGEADAADVIRLLAGFRDWWGYGSPSEDALARGVERLLGDSNTDFLLGAAGGAASPAGVCALRYRYGVWLDGIDCCLEDLFVEESARGSGLGAQLVEAAIERARERGSKRMELDVNDANETARRLYERFGFSSHVAELGADNRFMRLRL